MKKKTGVWLDTSKAVIVHFENNEKQIVEIISEIENRVHHQNEGNKGTFMGTHHINMESKFEERKKHQFDDYLDQILNNIKGSDEIMVFGPAEAKIKLKQKIMEDKTIQKDSLKAVETADSMSQNQMVAKVKDFFKL